MGTIADLRLLPLLDKETVRMRAAELLSSSYRGPVVKTHTSGTTGKALHLQISRAGYQRSQACLWHLFTWFGARYPARLATLAGHPVAPPDRMAPPFWVTDWFEPERFFSSQHLTDDTLPLYAQYVGEFRPDVVRGYPSSLYVLARKVVEAGLPTARPKVVVTSSETLLMGSERPSLPPSSVRWSATTRVRRKWLTSSSARRAGTTCSATPAWLRSCARTGL